MKQSEKDEILEQLEVLEELAHDLSQDLYQRYVIEATLDPRLCVPTDDTDSRKMRKFTLLAAACKEIWDSASAIVDAMEQAGLSDRQEELRDEVQARGLFTKKIKLETGDLEEDDDDDKEWN